MEVALPNSDIVTVMKDGEGRGWKTPLTSSRTIRSCRPSILGARTDVGPPRSYRSSCPLRAGAYPAGRLPVARQGAAVAGRRATAWASRPSATPSWAWVGTQSGHIRLDSDEITGLNPNRVARKGIALGAAGTAYVPFAERQRTPDAGGAKGRRALDHRPGLRHLSAPCGAPQERRQPAFGRRNSRCWPSAARS